MGHKVNALKFRLRNHWNSFWYTRSKNLKKNWFFQDLSINEYITRVLLTQNSFLINSSILRDSDRCLVFIKYFNVQKFKTFSKKSKKKKKNLKDVKRLIKYKSLKKLNFIKNHIENNLNKYYPEFKFYIKFFELKQKYSVISPRLLRFKFYQNFKDIYRFIEASFKYKSPEILAFGLSRFLSKTPRHNYFLTVSKFVILLFFGLNFKRLNFRGVRVEVNGKLNGSDRTKKRVIQFGAMPFSTCDANIKYKFTESFTRYGIFGVKVWFFLLNKSYFNDRILNFKNFTKFLIK